MHTHGPLAQCRSGSGHSDESGSHRTTDQSRGKARTPAAASPPTRWGWCGVWLSESRAEEEEEAAWGRQGKNAISKALLVPYRKKVNRNGPSQIFHLLPFVVRLFYFTPVSFFYLKVLCWPRIAFDLFELVFLRQEICIDSVSYIHTSDNVQGGI